MSRIHNFLVVLLIITVAVIVHMMAISVFPPLQDDLAHENGDTFNQAENMDDIYQVLAIWVPLIMSGGVIVWAAAKEYERQRDTARQVRPRP